MSMLPMLSQAERIFLILATSEIEPILISLALAQGLECKTSRIFTSPFGLGSLADVPAFRHGKTRTLVLNFPSPGLARNPVEALQALRLAIDLTWVSEHPTEEEEFSGLRGIRLVRVQGSLWDAACQAMGCSLDTIDPLKAISAELPIELPSPESAGRDLAWRYALEAARQEPFLLGPTSEGLIKGKDAEPELVFSGWNLIRERRELAERSSFHVFDVPTGKGMVVAVPRTALGFYLDLARDARRYNGCVVSILAFDSGEPVIIEYSEPPPDFSLKMELVKASFPGHMVRNYGRAGMAIKGPEAGSQKVIESLIEILSSGIH